VARSSDYWDTLAPHHASIENNYLDLPSLRRIVHDIHQPVLVVGAGQGLIVAELRKTKRSSMHLGLLILLVMKNRSE
jgi:hypothetical protein